MSVLQDICTRKQEHIKVKIAEISFNDMKTKAYESKTKQVFRKKILDTALNKNIALIAEVKKASPSNGIIRHDFNPVDIAKAYERAGATCLSILTDAPYFQGHDTYLQQIRAVTSLPLLRKDFMIDPYQIYESRVLGADCILLIMAALTDAQAQDMAGITTELGMDVLCEVHDPDELERAVKLDFDMIGINNRNLKTLDVSLQRGLDMAQNLPDYIVKIAESGIYSQADILMFQQAGFHGFLVGESLMRQNDIETATRKLLTRP